MLVQGVKKLNVLVVFLGQKYVFHFLVIHIVLGYQESGLVCIEAAENSNLFACKCSKSGFVPLAWWSKFNE